MRVGTSGALDERFAPGTVIASQYCIGLDGVLHFYNHQGVDHEDVVKAFVEHTGWGEKLPYPYCVKASDDLLQRIAFDMEKGVAQIFKENHNGQFRGGPSYYIEKGLKCKWLAVVFAVCSVIACGVFMPPVQSNGIAIAFANSFQIKPVYVGAIVALLLGLVIIGGVKRIAQVAQIVAPFMAMVYVVMSGP